MPLPKRKGAIEAVLKWTRKGLDLGQQVALLVPIPVFGPISQILIKIIDQIADVRTNKRDAEAVLQDIQTLAEIVGKSKEELDSRTALLSTTDQRMLESRFLASSGLPGRFGQFYNDLKDLELLSEGLHHKWYLPRFLFSDNDADIIQDIRDGVSKAKTFFETRCQVVIQEYLQAIDGRLAEVQSTINHVETVVVGAEVARKMEADNRTLESLPHADASYRASINELKSRFLEGTRSSLFAELEKWIDSDLSNSSICVLSGGAGTGKSTVASELARRLDCCHGKLGASFFFAHGVTDLDSTRVFFPTIAYQLAHWTEGTLRQPIIDAAREHLSKGMTQAMAYEAPALLHAPLDRADKKNLIFVVVDALDECTQDAYTLVPEMLNLLMTSTKHGPLCIFLTFRPEQLIESQLLSPQWPSVIHTISIDTFSDDAIRDVAAFIRARFSGMGDQGVALLRQRPEDANRLAARAQGLFIYARTTMDFLETYPGTLEEGVNILLSEEEGVTLGTLDQLALPHYCS